MCRQWHLVQVDMESTIEINPNYATNGQYWCVFHYKHPTDNRMSD